MTVITGIGVVAPTGNTTAEHWAATLRAESALARVRRFDPSGYRCQVAGEAPAFDPAEHLPSRLIPQTDHMTKLALIAAKAALADAGIDPADLPRYGAGVVTAATGGGYEFGQRELQKMWALGPEHVSAYQSFAWFYAVNTGQISIRHGLRGPGGVAVADQSGALQAVAMARRQLRKGTPVMLTGAVDSALCPWGWVAMQVSGELSPRPEPDRAYRPFDADAQGWVPGEGGAILVLENDTTKPHYAHISGHASTYGEALVDAIRLCLADAGMEPDDVGVVFADGAGVPSRDAVEAAAITAVFGPAGVPVTVPKTMTGRLLSGGAAVDLATAALALRHQVIPPTVNLTRPVPELDLVLDRPRPGSIGSALVLSSGPGGFHEAVLLTRPKECMTC
jgi:act minimal PKS chain-length factor (CLF/KS beta)